MGLLIPGIVIAQDPPIPGFSPDTASLVGAATTARPAIPGAQPVAQATPNAQQAQIAAQQAGINIPPEIAAQVPLTGRQVELPPLPNRREERQEERREERRGEGRAQIAPAAQTMMPTPGAAPSSPTFGTIDDPAFQNIIKKTFPLTPEQIAALHLILQEHQRAAAAPADSPTPTLSTQTVVLAPGTTPPVLRLANGYVSSIVFLDETGQPWPISGYTIGNPQVFNINWDGKSNILMMQGVGRYETGNLAVLLNGLATPIMLTIASDQTVVDYRIDFRVAGRGPFAKAPLIGGTLPKEADSALMDLLEGVPPVGSQRLVVMGGPAEAWVSGQKLFVRTPLTLISPGWDATMSSVDGTKAYEMNVAPMLLAVQDGQTITLRLEGL